jgi:DNA-binding MarR family transcriptional regulator
VAKALNNNDVATQLNDELQREADQRSEQNAISGDEVRLLRILAEEGELTLRDLTLMIKSNTTRARHYIDRLIERDFVQYIGSYIDDDQFALTAEGRELAVRNNWV